MIYVFYILYFTVNILLLLGSLTIFTITWVKNPPGQDNFWLQMHHIMIHIANINFVFDGNRVHILLFFSASIMSSSALLFLIKCVKIY